MSTLKIKFGIVSDLHYACEDDGERLKTLSTQKLIDAIAFFKESNVDFILNLGDTIDLANSIDAEINLCHEINEIFSTINVPIYHVVGNHDVAMLSKEEFLNEMHLKSAYYSFISNGIQFCILDGNCREDGSDFSRDNSAWDNAWISQTQLDWLADELQKSDEPTIICCHERLDGGVYNFYSDPHVIKNYAELNKIIQKSGNIIAVLSGHDHNGYVAYIDKIPYITCPAMVVCDTNAYAVAEIYADNCIKISGVGRFPRIFWEPS